MVIRNELNETGVGTYFYKSRNSRALNLEGVLKSSLLVTFTFVVRLLSIYRYLPTWIYAGAGTDFTECQYVAVRGFT